MSKQQTISRWQLVIHAVRRLKSRYVTLGVVLGLSTAAIVFATGVSSYGAAQSSDDAIALQSLRDIHVYANGSPITEDTISRFAGIPHAVSVVPFVRVMGGLRATGDDISLIGVTSDALPPSLLLGEFGDDSSESWVVLPATIGANDYRDQIGKTITVTVTVATDSQSGAGRDLKLKVVGVCDPSYQVDALNAAYISLTAAKQLFMDRYGLKDQAQLAAYGGYENATVSVDSQDNVASVLAQLQADGFRAVSVAQEVAQVPGVIEIMRVIAVAVAVVLLLICVIVTTMVVSSTVRQRMRELGVLRATGWSSGGILRLWLLEAATVSVASILLGTVVGVAVTAWCGNWLRASISGGNLSPVSYSFWAVAGPGLVLIIAALASEAIATKLSSRFDIATLLKLF